MKITYLGTGAAEGVPAMFCNCETCKTVRAMGGKEIRTRTQILIDDELCIDFPPDAYFHSIAHGVDLSAIKSLLVTHSHMDHFYAHDFILHGSKYGLSLKSETLKLFGNAEVKKVFAECTRREMREDVAQTLPMSEIKPFDSFVTEGYAVTAFPAVHSKEEQALLYLVEKDGKAYLHLHDTGMLTEETYVWLKTHGKKVGLVSMDCTLVDTHSSTSGRHMGLDENAALMSRLKADGVADENTKFVITHFSHNSAPFTARLEALGKTYGVIPAYDGLSIEI